MNPAQFEESLQDLQTLVIDQKSSLEKALNLIAEGKEDEAQQVLKEAIEAKDFDPNVGGGVDRDKLDKSDFVDSERRRFPIVNSGDVMDAVHSYGRANPKIPFDEFKSRLTAIAKRKGFESQLPAEWTKDTSKKASEIFANGYITGVMLAEAGKPIQIIKTGEFQHPNLGKIVITKSDLDEMVKHFNNNVRGQQVPVDVDHKHELGAVGWYKSLKGPVSTGDGSHALFADINWTDDGRQKLEGGSFKYFSPHFGEWRDPQSGKKYNNVLLSGAITNFPFLKGMQPISLNELEDSMAETAEVTALKEQVTALSTKFDEFVAKMAKAPSGKADSDNDAEDKKEGPEGDDNDAEDKAEAKTDAKKNSNMSESAKLTELVEAKTSALQKQLTEATNQLKLIEKEKRQLKFRELATGKHGDDPHWIGDIDTHVELMEALADGNEKAEESEQFKKYVALQSSHARQVAEGNLFKEFGTTASGPMSEDDELDAAVKKFREADSKLTESEAIEKVLSENHKLYAVANRRHMKRVADAGG